MQSSLLKYLERLRTYYRNADYDPVLVMSTPTSTTTPVIEPAPILPGEPPIYDTPLPSTPSTPPPPSSPSSALPTILGAAGAAIIVGTAVWVTWRKS